MKATSCPKCNGPTRSRKREVFDVVIDAIACDACHLVGIVGSDEPWIPTDRPVMELHDMAERANAKVARSHGARRYGEVTS